MHLLAVESLSHAVIVRCLIPHASADVLRQLVFDQHGERGQWSGGDSSSEKAASDGTSEKIQGVAVFSRLMNGVLPNDIH